MPILERVPAPTASAADREPRSPSRRSA